MIKFFSIVGFTGLSILSTEAAITPILLDLGVSENSTTYGDTSIATDHDNYTGDGFLAYNNNTGSGFTVEAPYEFSSVTIRYSSASTNAGEYYVYIDESESLAFTGDTIVFTQTDDWDTWIEVTIELSGDAGDYFNLAFADDATNDGGINIDSIEFTPVPEPTTCALLLGLATLTGAATRRRRSL
jgi:hypothetical protein